MCRLGPETKTEQTKLTKNGTPPAQQLRTLTSTILQPNWTKWSTTKLQMAVVKRHCPC